MIKNSKTLIKSFYTSIIHVLHFYHYNRKCFQIMEITDIYKIIKQQYNLPFLLESSSKQEKITLAPRLKPIKVTGLFPCSLANRTSASCFPASVALCVHTCHGLSIAPDAAIKAAGQAIAVMIPVISFLKLKINQDL